jgi:SAM-dependent methyltransferase
VDWVHGGTDPEVHEREDGYLEVGAGPELYVAGFEDWPAPEQRAMSKVRGRALDVGCGAGRVALHLQETGVDVVAVDASALAVRAARAKGVRHVRMASVQSLGATVGAFDTVLLMGNNTGMLGTPPRLRSTLGRWARRMAPGARIIAESTSPYGGGVPVLDSAYRRRNRQRGRMPGQLRLRVRYRQLASPWLSWLFLSDRELTSLVEGTGWCCTEVVGGEPEEAFVAVLERR